MRSLFSRPSPASWWLTVSLALVWAGCSPASNAREEPRNSTSVADTTKRSADTSETTADTSETEGGEKSDETQAFRVATFNTSLSRDEAGQLVEALEGGDDPQARKVAEILQRVRPDVVLLNEFDYDERGKAARLFDEQYLEVGHGGASSIDYPHRYVPETNTGVHSGVDLNGDGDRVSTPGEDGYAADAYGFGEYPGQYGMVVYSRFPIAKEEIRTFRTFLWREMPDDQIPRDWYSDEAVDTLRLSSKNHVDIPIKTEGRRLHILASHPTPPSFDGEADRNGRRNHDEIRLWTDYLSGGDAASYIRDDSGGRGGLDRESTFVLVGDLNSDPHDGESRHGAIRNLLEHPRTRDPRPGSEAAVQKAESDGEANEDHEGDPRLDTADFPDDRVGNLRVDYALPSEDVAIEDAGVFWPAPDDENSELASVSDHRLVWVDLTAKLRLLDAPPSD